MPSRCADYLSATENATDVTKDFNRHAVADVLVQGVA